jgi:hypothetical protein
MDKPKVKKTNNPSRSSLFMKLDYEALERARNAAYWEPGVTLTSLVELGIAKVVDELETRNQKPYPPRKGELKRGVRAA